MIVNILRFSFRAETTDEQKAATLAAMRRTAAVESVSFSVPGEGRDLPRVGPPTGRDPGHPSVT